MVEEPPAPPPGFHIKSGPWWRLRQWRGRRWRSSSEVRSSCRCSAVGERTLRPASPSLAATIQGLPAGIMRGPELPIVLLALVLCQAPLGPAAPAPVGGGTVLAKMYPRGNHWAVGHLMGKKNTGDFPYVSQGDGLKQQLREYIQWEEAARNLLGLIQAKEDRSHQPPQRQPLGNRQPTWDSEDSSNLKDLADSLLRLLQGKEGTPS